MGRLFGTDGVRGKAGSFPLDESTVTRLGAALVRALRQGDAPVRVLAGRDTRESGEWIERALAVGISSQGGSLTSAGVIPTPAIAYLTPRLGFTAGVVISASHNPFEDNGIKVFSGAGEKFTEAREEQVEAILVDGSWSIAGGSPTVEQADLRGAYVDHLVEILHGPSDQPSPRLWRSAEALATADRTGPTADRRAGPSASAKAPADRRSSESEGWFGPAFSVAIDCANGATVTVAPRVFEALGITTTVIGAEPNGRNINLHCGSTHPERLANTVTEGGHALGIAYDGDGDRAIFIDEQGRTVDGDQVLLMCARQMKHEGRLRGNAVVATVMSNIGLELALRESGIELRRTSVGDKYVMEELLRHNLPIGGEQSGHVIFADDLFTGDGIATSLNVLRTMASTGRSLGDLASDMVAYPQVLLNLRVRERFDLRTVPSIAQVIESVESRLAGHGRLLVRYSGTEPLLRVMLEGRDVEEIGRWGQEIIDAVKAHPGSGTA